MHSNDYATAQSLMVSVTVSSLGATQLHFLEPGVKVNGDYYRNAVLLNMVLLDIRSVFGDYYVFQQDGAQACMNAIKYEYEYSRTVDEFYILPRIVLLRNVPIAPVSGDDISLQSVQYFAMVTKINVFVLDLVSEDLVSSCQVNDSSLGLDEIS